MLEVSSNDQLSFITMPPNYIDDTEEILSPSYPMEKQFITASFEPTSKEEDLLIDFEPTPIGPNGISSVEQVPIGKLPWDTDTSFVEYMKVFLDCSTRRPQDSLVTPEESSFETSCRPLQVIRRSSATRNSSDAASRTSHVEQWNLRYQELVEFRAEFKHCLVPLNWPPNKLDAYELPWPQQEAPPADRPNDNEGRNN